MLCVDQHLVTLVNSSLAELTPAVLPSSVTEEDVQQSVVSAIADLAPSTSNTSSTASAVTDQPLQAEGKLFCSLLSSVWFNFKVAYCKTCNFRMVFIL